MKNLSTLLFIVIFISGCATNPWGPRSEKITDVGCNTLSLSTTPVERPFDQALTAYAAQQKYPIDQNGRKVLPLFGESCIQFYARINEGMKKGIATYAQTETFNKNVVISSGVSNNGVKYLLDATAVVLPPVLAYQGIKKIVKGDTDIARIHGQTSIQQTEIAALAAIEVSKNARLGLENRAVDTTRISYDAGDVNTGAVTLNDGDVDQRTGDVIQEDGNVSQSQKTGAVQNGNTLDNGNSIKNISTSKTGAIENGNIVDANSSAKTGKIGLTQNDGNINLDNGNNVRTNSQSNPNIRTNIENQPNVITKVNPTLTANNSGQKQVNDMNQKSNIEFQPNVNGGSVKGVTATASPNINNKAGGAKVNQEMIDKSRTNVEGMKDFGVNAQTGKIIVKPMNIQKGGNQYTDLNNIGNPKQGIESNIAPVNTLRGGNQEQTRYGDQNKTHLTANGGKVSDLLIKGGTSNAVAKPNIEFQPTISANGGRSNLSDFGFTANASARQKATAQQEQELISKPTINSINGDCSGGGFDRMSGHCNGAPLD